MIHKIRSYIMALLVLGSTVATPLHAANNTPPANKWGAIATSTIIALLMAGIVASNYQDHYNKLPEHEKPSKRQYKINILCSAIVGALLGGFTSMGHTSMFYIKRATSLTPPSKVQKKQSPKANTQEEGDCPICLESITMLKKNCAPLARTSCCKNIFCHNCLELTLRSKQECPLCRNEHIRAQTYP